MAAKLYRESEQGFPLGELAVALGLLGGKPGEASVRQATTLLEKARAAGVPAAAAELGEIYLGTNGVPGIPGDREKGLNSCDPRRMAAPLATDSSTAGSIGLARGNLPQDRGKGR